MKIDGELTQEMSLIDAVKKLRGPEGTTVTISIFRKGPTELKDFTLTRAIIQIKSVRWKKLPDDIGYVRLNRFQGTTSEELKEALQGLEAQYIRGLILDLRNNPGGLLGQAIAVADEFLAAGKLIVYTKGRLVGQNMKALSKNDAAHLGYPMAILINRGSASASEIVAGALQDLRRATIIGTQSFGKGAVQTIIPLSDGSALRLTTARYYTPYGQEIHGRGITPDIEVDPQEKQEDTEKNNSAQIGRQSLGDLEADFQLQQAVAFIMTKQASGKPRTDSN